MPRGKGRLVRDERAAAHLAPLIFPFEDNARVDDNGNSGGDDDDDDAHEDEVDRVMSFEEYARLSDLVAESLGRFKGGLRIVSPSWLRDYVRSHRTLGAPMLCSPVEAMDQGLADLCERFHLSPEAQEAIHGYMESMACGNCGSTGVLIHDEPEEVAEKPRPSHIRVPLLFDNQDRPVLSTWILPLSAMLAGIFADKRLADSIDLAPSGSSTFGHYVDGGHFQRVVAATPNGAVPVVIGIYTDGSNPAQSGTRSVLMVYAVVLNSVLPLEATMHLVGVVPTLTNNPLFHGLSAGTLSKMRQWIFQATLMALYTSGNLYEDEDMMEFLLYDGAPIIVAPSLGARLCDSKDGDKTAGHRSGGVRLCFRCDAHVLEDDFPLWTRAAGHQVAVIEQLAVLAAAEHGTVGPARAALKSAGHVEVLSSVSNLRSFEASRNIPLCRLHVGKLTVSLTLLATLGTSCATTPTLLGPEVAVLPKASGRMTFCGW